MGWVGGSPTTKSSRWEQEESNAMKLGKPSHRRLSGFKRGAGPSSYIQ